MMQHRKPLKSSPPPPPLTPSSPTINLKQFPKLKPILISMAALLSLALILFFALSAASHHKPAVPLDLKTYSLIGEVCKASRDPTACRASLSEPGRVPQNATVVEAIQSAMWVSSKNLDSGRGMVRSILDASAASPTRSNAARSCLEFLRYSDHRMASAAAALPRGELKDARAWMSASLVYQYDCWSALKYVNDTSLVNKTMAFFYSSVIATSSNSLGMMVNYDVFGEKTESWGPVKTERDGFWEHLGSKSPSGHAMSVPTGLKADVSVCKEGEGCDYKTVQEAVNAGPDNSTKMFVIWIKTGVYEETVRVPLEKKNMVMLGDGIGKSVITGSMSVDQDGISTYNSATVGVVGDGFMAKGLTFQNTAGPIAHQAVAFRSDSDQSIVENCEFLGNQDTLYAHSLRQYYKSCIIQGNVDFIFGNSASFFQDCLILIAPRQVKPEKGEKNAVTAHGRIDPAQSTGFVFQNCVVNGTDSYMGLYRRKPSVHRSYLGRPWKEYSRTVFLGCVMEVVVMGEGWMPWSGDFALRTLFYGEFENRGIGSDLSRRVSWSSRVPAERVSAYSVENFIQGDKWVNLASNS